MSYSQFICGAFEIRGDNSDWNFSFIKSIPIFITVCKKIYRIERN